MDRLSLQNMALKVEGGPLAQWSRATQLFTSVPVAWEKQQQSSCPLVLGSMDSPAVQTPHSILDRGRRWVSLRLLDGLACRAKRWRNHGLVAGPATHEVP